MSRRGGLPLRPVAEAGQTLEGLRLLGAHIPLVNPWSPRPKPLSPLIPEPARASGWSVNPPGRAPAPCRADAGEVLAGAEVLNNGGFCADLVNVVLERNFPTAAPSGKLAPEGIGDRRLQRWRARIDYVTAAGGLRHWSGEVEAETVEKAWNAAVSAARREVKAIRELGQISDVRLDRIKS